MEQSGHITLAAETIGHIFDIPVTNTLLVTWVSSVVLIVFAFASTRKMTLVPVSYLQGVAEVVIETGYNLIDDLAHGKVKTLLPILMTFFLYIITANWIGLLPGFGTIGFYGQEMGKETFVPLFRSINSDLNATLALALVSVVGTHIFAGEAVLATISSLFAFVLPLPFYFLEIIVGFVQAAVFMMLTLVFIVLLTQKHDEA